jgi:hypothetical protein
MSEKREVRERQESDKRYIKIDTDAKEIRERRQMRELR